MPQPTDFVSEFDFIGAARQNPLDLPSDEPAIRSRIAQNTRSAEEIEQAFMAMQQAQQPTTFDKIGDVALAAAAIADLSTGNIYRRGEAGEKFRTLRAGREERKQAKRDRAAKKFLQQVRLKEFTGDIASKSLALAMDISQQEAKNITTNLAAGFKAATTKAAVKESEARVKKLGEKPKEPTQAEIDAANRQALGDFDKDIYKQALDTVGKFDPEGEETYEQYLGRVSATYQRIWMMRNAVMNPPKPEPGAVDTDLGRSRAPSLNEMRKLFEDGTPATSDQSVFESIFDKLIGGLKSGGESLLFGSEAARSKPERPGR